MSDTDYWKTAAGLSRLSEPSTNEENGLYQVSLVANEIVELDELTVDPGTLTPALQERLHKIDGVDASVASGSHANELLFWGHGGSGTGAGAAPRRETDFDLAACTNGHRTRGAAYFTAALELLIGVQEEIVAIWGADRAARPRIAAQFDAADLTSILTGLASPLKPRVDPRPVASR
ncbi:MAG: imelysin family protein [Pseudomonadota bacterium]